MPLVRGALRRIGRLLEPLFAPDAEVRREREERLLVLAREQKTALTDLADRSAAQMRRSLDAHTADMAEVNARLAELRTGVRRHSLALGRLARRAGVEAELEWAEQRVIERLERIARGRGPVIVGPWTGEVGFELLYWIPFLRWALDKYGVAPDRVVIVSRGGTEHWYDGLAGQYVDVFSLAGLDEFRRASEAMKKQRFMRGFDRRLLRQARGRISASADVLHPALMYSLFMPFWKRQAAVSRVLEHAQYRRIAAPPDVVLPPLPARYVAVRFYFSNCFPDTPANREFVASAVTSLAESTDVVMLNPGLSIDDHVDYSTGARSRVHYIHDAVRPENNLAVQTAIVARAQAFVGTYGGFSYLAPMCGVDALAFYSDRNYFVHHLDLVERVLPGIGGGTLQPVATGVAPWLRKMLTTGLRAETTGL